MHNNPKRYLRILFIILLVLVALAALLIRPTDHTPYQQTSFYDRTLSGISSFKPDSSQQVQAGWGRGNITPHSPAPLVAYGRQFNNFKEVADSCFARVFMFRQGGEMAALVCLDLWIMLPGLKAKLSRVITEQFPAVQQVYVTITHSHHSFGGWMPGLTGRLILGKYDQAIEKKLISGTLQAAKQAVSSIHPVTVAYKEVEAGEFVKNRLVSGGRYDSLVRCVVLQKPDQRAIITVFSAHATYLKGEIKELSGDYPASLCRALESSGQYSFAAFSAGGMASHTPVKRYARTIEGVSRYGKAMAEKIISQTDSLSGKPVYRLGITNVPIQLREPNLRITDNLILAPAVFNVLLGKQTFTLSFLQLGDCVFTGFPGELSGQFYEQLSEKINRHVIMTSFSGAYCGYVTLPEYYSLKKYETRDMNWYGPDTGPYAMEIINRVLKN